MKQAERFRVLAPDLSGYGESAAGEGARPGGLTLDLELVMALIERQRRPVQRGSLVNEQPERGKSEAGLECGGRSGPFEELRLARGHTED